MSETNYICCFPMFNKSKNKLQTQSIQNVGNFKVTINVTIEPISKIDNIQVPSVKINLNEDKQVSVEVKEVPVILKEELVEVKELPVEVKELPVEVKELPVEVKELPVEVKELPVEVKELPVEVKELPVEVKELPVEESVKVSLILSNEVSIDSSIKAPIEVSVLPTINELVESCIVPPVEILVNELVNSIVKNSQNDSKINEITSDNENIQINEDDNNLKKKGVKAKINFTNDNKDSISKSKRTRGKKIIL